MDREQCSEEKRGLLNQNNDRIQSDFRQATNDLAAVAERIRGIFDRESNMEHLTRDWSPKFRSDILYHIYPILDLITHIELLNHRDRRDERLKQQPDSVKRPSRRKPKCGK